MVCNSRFRLRRGGLTQFCINFCDTEQVISDQKEIMQKLFMLPSVISDQEEISQKWVRLPRLKQDLETWTTYGPRTWRRGLSA